ncbi:MAG: hypothetical protein M3R13_07455 [Armatimonadota bacterium]|nr:hypothetical protein [Armatimonadota bacterium]
MRETSGIALRLQIPLGTLILGSLLLTQTAATPAIEPQHPPTAATQRSPDWAAELTTVYRIADGGGPRYTGDPNKKVIRIDGRNRVTSMIAMTAEGGCQAVDSYDFGRVNFDDGTTIYLNHMTVEGWSGYPPALVSGTPE